VDFPSPQSVALFGHQGIARDDPDFFPAFVLNQILGGGNFRSRLMQEVRVERGLTYGVYSYSALRNTGRPWPGVLVLQRPGGRGDRGDPRRVADLAENGVTEAELDAASATSPGPTRCVSTATDASRASLPECRPTACRWTTSPRATTGSNAVTSRMCAASPRGLLQPEALHFVVVGRPEGLEPSN
jgi:zinc protease